MSRNTAPDLPLTGALLPNKGASLLHGGALLPNKGALLRHGGALSPNKGPLSLEEGSFSPDEGALSPDEGALSVIKKWLTYVNTEFADNKLMPTRLWGVLPIGETLIARFSAMGILGGDPLGVLTSLL